MELKYDKSNSVFLRLEGSNRTFMELKYGFAAHPDKESAVLIVPLWNWNSLIA